MAGKWQTVRVFISSTFCDMYAERDALVRVVFPELRERLEKYRIHLDDIDLRWGVTLEQADNDRVLGLCPGGIKFPISDLVMRNFLANKAGQGTMVRAIGGRAGLMEGSSRQRGMDATPISFGID